MNWLTAQFSRLRRSAPKVPPTAADTLGPVRGPVQGTESLPPELQRIIRPSAMGNWLYATPANYTPDMIESTLRLGQFGDIFQQWQLFQLMEDTWPRLAKNLKEIKDAAAAKQYAVLPYTEDEEEPTPEAIRRADVARAGLFGMKAKTGQDANNFRGTIRDTLDCWGKCVSLLETDWEMRPSAKLGTIIAPQTTRWIHPQNYGYDFSEGRIALRRGAPQSVIYQPSQQLVDDSSAFEELAEHKFICGISKARSGVLTGAALLRPLAYWWAVSNFTSAWLLNFAQIFGVPLRWATYDPARTDLKPLIERMLDNMGSSGWAVFPAGTTLEIKEAIKSAADNPQVHAHDLADKLADLLILGQTLTSDVGAHGNGSRALGTVHNSVRQGNIDNAAQLAAEVIEDQLIPSIIELNFGDRDMCPRLVPESSDKADPLLMAQRDAVFLTAKVPLKKSWFYKRHDMPEPSEGDAVVIGAGGPVAPAGDGENQGESEPVKAGNRTHLRQGYGGQGAAGDGKIYTLETVRMSDAQGKLVDHMLEDITGIDAQWLGGTKAWFAALVTTVQDPAHTDEQVITILEAKARNVPAEILPHLNDEAITKTLEAYMGAAVVNGAVSGYLKRPVLAKRRAA